MIISLFETPLHIIECDLELDSLYSRIKDFQIKIESSYRSNSGGYQGHHFEDENLMRCIKDNVPQRSDKPLLDFKVQSWVNINGNGHWNDVHNHCDDGVMLSGIFYIRCPENSGGIRLYDTRLNVSKTYSKYYEEERGSYMKINPHPNLMLFFPPWLMHLVEPNQSDGERVSVAFNILNPVF
jgi:hypothetical protein